MELIRLRAETAKIVGDIGNKFGSFSDESRRKAQKAGLFMASIHDEVFELKTPAYFVPRDFSQPFVAS